MSESRGHPRHPEHTTGEPAVTMSGAVFQYGANVVIERSDLVIPDGTITTLIGPNGAGKSTLLNAIAGLVTPSAGRLTVENLHGRPRRVAYVLQDTKINQSLPVSAREVVSMGRYHGKGPFRLLNREDRRMVDEAMERMDLQHLSNRHLSRMSGGQRHRVLLAQGLAQEHDILLLDEPVTGLDVVSIQAIRDTVREENEAGCTVVITTHDLADAWEADYVVLLAGRVVTSGPPEEVLQASWLTEAYGEALMSTEGTHLLIDDPHHSPTGSRHEHARSIHVEQDPAGLHSHDHMHDHIHG